MSLEKLVPQRSDIQARLSAAFARIPRQPNNAKAREVLTDIIRKELARDYANIPEDMREKILTDLNSYQNWPVDEPPISRQV